MKECENWVWRNEKLCDIKTGKVASKVSVGELASTEPSNANYLGYFFCNEKKILSHAKVRPQHQWKLLPKFSSSTTTTQLNLIRIQSWIKNFFSFCMISDNRCPKSRFFKILANYKWKSNSRSITVKKRPTHQFQKTLEFLVMKVSLR